MPHECTTCGRTFPDGSKEMLSGCPDCGGNKFQFAPARSSADTGTADSDPPDGDTGPAAEFEQGWESATAEPTPAESSDRKDLTSREWPETARPPTHRSRDPTNSSQRQHSSTEVASEDAAQKTARTDIVSDDDLPASPSDSSGSDGSSVSPERTPPRDSEVPDHGRVASEPSGEEPSIDELRAELNEQFESIKILSPGQYELNLMELYNREEYIISLQRDGRYVINVPETWRDADE